MVIPSTDKSSRNSGPRNPELIPEQGSKPSPAWKWFLKVALLLVLMVILVRFVKGLDTELLLGRVVEGDRKWWLVALGCLGIRLAVWNARWYASLREAGAPSPWAQTLPALLGAIFLNSVTPTGRVAGGLFRTRHAAREGQGEIASVLGSVLYDQVIHQVVALAVTVLSVLILGVATGQQLWVAAAIGTTLLVVSMAWGIPAWSRSYRRRRGKGESERSSRQGGWNGLVRWVASRFEQQGGRSLGFVSEGREAFRVFRRLVRNPRLGRFGVVLSLLMILLLGCAEWCCFLSLDANPGLVACFVAVSVGMAVGGLVGTPGGVGGVEAGMVMALTSLGVEPADALAATVLFRALHYLIVLGLGVPALFWCEATRRR